MSDPTAPEPTMEEILASIRRIISEDDKPAEAAEPAAVEPVAHTPPLPAPEPEPEAHPAAAEPVAAAHPAAVEEEDVLELTEPAPAHPETHGDLEVFTPKAEPHAFAPPPPASEPRTTAQPRPTRTATYEEVDEAGLLSGGAEDAVLSHFGRLSQTIAMPKSARTLEDVVRELLRPLLSDWLDEHLPRIVEEKVQAEVERIARRRS